jgi:hypothetical protein
MIAKRTAAGGSMEFVTAVQPIKGGIAPEAR